MVYFIEAVGADLVKIGFTDGDPVERMRQLQTGSAQPLRLRATIEGGYQRERELQRHFAHLREKGEWFRLTIEMEAFIAVASYVLPRLFSVERRLSDLIYGDMPDVRFQARSAAIRADRNRAAVDDLRRELDELRPALGLPACHQPDEFFERYDPDPGIAELTENDWQDDETLRLMGDF